SVGAYRGCVGGLNGFSSVSRSLTIDRTLPTIFTKKPIATAPPTARMIKAILMRLGISVCSRLRRCRESLHGISDGVSEAVLETAVHQRLRFRSIVEVSNFEQQRRHCRAAQYL